MDYDFALFFSYFLIYLIQFLTLLIFFLFLKITSGIISFGIPYDNYQTKIRCIYHLELYHYVYLRFLNSFLNTTSTSTILNANLGLHIRFLYLKHIGNKIVQTKCCSTIFSVFFYLRRMFL